MQRQWAEHPSDPDFVPKAVDERSPLYAKTGRSNSMQVIR
eukprot:COSAG04_NODE_11382_length_712_cov_1.171289_1_plen_39_part_10